MTGKLKAPESWLGLLEPKCCICLQYEYRTVLYCTVLYCSDTSTRTVLVPVSSGVGRYTVLYTVALLVLGAQVEAGGLWMASGHHHMSDTLLRQTSRASVYGS